MPLRRLERKGSRDESGLAWNWRFGGGDGCIGKGVGDLLSVWTGTFCSAILARHYHCLERLSKKRRYYYCGFYPFLLVRGEWVTVTGLTWRSSSLAGGVDSDKRYHDPSCKRRRLRNEKRPFFGSWYHFLLLVLFLPSDAKPPTVDSQSPTTGIHVVKRSPASYISC
jgi:hypothetical protein